MKICTVEGCPYKGRTGREGRVVKGFCLNHYWQWRRETSPEMRTAGAAANKKYRLANPEKQKVTNRNSSMKVRYRQTPEMYNERLAKQGGVCALCGKPPIDGKPLSFDHDHKCCSTHRTCGECLRGLVHARCNTLLATADDDPNLLLKAVAYLAQ